MPHLRSGGVRIPEFYKHFAPTGAKAAHDILNLACMGQPEGGAFVVVENLIDDARRENAFGLMMSLNMLIEFGEAFDFTGADFDGWCREVGFKRTEVMHLAGPASAGIAYKYFTEGLRALRRIK